MDKNIRIILQYDGTRYDGWQKQGNTDQTIQGRLESVLEKMASVPIEVQGSGRTDAGVHAHGQVANFFISENFFKNCGTETKDGRTDAKFVKEYLNHYLPEDIAVLEASEAEPRFHSRLNAVSKTYVYKIETADKKDVFERKYRYKVGQELDLQAMRRVASCLVGTHDFKSFSSLKKAKKSTTRTLSSIEITEEGTQVIITYEADGFLYNMARILTGTLIEVGLHEKTLDEVKMALTGNNRALAGPTAPAEGLFLEKVTY
ncbi:MAG: tRNA pseudouridine(38-40) synthase TruA [Clostridium sp.]